MTKQKTCQEKIRKELQDRIEEFKDAMKYFEGRHREEEEGQEYYEDYEDFGEWLNSISLDYSDDEVYRGKQLLLSTGGPEDYFIFFENGDITYHYNDWFDGAKIYLRGEDLDIMREVYENYLDF